MNPAARRACLGGLGLVDWRLREPPAAAADSPAIADAAAETPVALPQRETADAAVEPTPAAGRPDLSTLGWDELQAWLERQDRRGAQRAVFGTGARDADLLVIGEAPGAQEDVQGLPFVGPAGELLDRMLTAIGRSRERDVYITNICKFRPPGNRDPRPDEVAADWPVLERQIDLMAPKLVVAVGRVAAQTLLGSSDTLGKLRGSVHRYPKRELPVVATYHPAYLLRSPGEKAKSWADLRHIAAVLGGAAG